MKHLYLTIALLFLALIGSAQETVNVAFTASTESGLYCPFSSISVTNVTRGWTETLAYPDTVLVLTNTVGVDEHTGKAFCLGDAYPNPFTEETQALLELPEKGDVLLQVIRVDGSEIASQRHCLEAGTYRLRVSLSAPQLAFLLVTTGYGRQVTKLLHTGDGATDALDIDVVSTVTKSLGKSDPTRLDATGEFEPGDVMRYEARLMDEGMTVYSIALTQPQYGDEVITLLFALDKPTVITNDTVTNISHISANCGGNVTNAGGLMVTARGVCWSTMPNPTVSSSHTTDGTGTGEFHSLLLDLAVETTYYVRAYATNLLGTSYGDEIEFTTLPTPHYTITVSAIPSNGGTVSGGGTYLEGDSCTVSAYANPGYEFTCWIEKGVVVSTDAHYIFIVTGNRDLEAHFTQQTYTISVSASPSNGGTVYVGNTPGTTSGTYAYGQSCTVHANANTGYTFANWTENGNVVSSNPNYTFTVIGSRNLVAHFSQQTYTISVSANPSNGGTVSGGGSYNYGQWCTVLANTNGGYDFTNWTENGNVVSTNANYSFQVTNSRVLVAHFTESSQIPEGAIDGLFTINANGDQVYFSQGNLQYNAAQGTHQCADGTTKQGTWRFAENQWDYVGTQTPDPYGNVGGTVIGSDNLNIAQDYDGWIDLFGWGTSGWENGNLYYRPYDYEYLEYPGGDFGFGYGPTDGTNYCYSLTGIYANADWGIYNSISNGGNQANQWRTLTQPEWAYVFNTRTTNSGIRYVKANVNNVNGVILLPDDWSTSYYSLSNTNTFSSNIITASQWSTLEQHGAVFLPAAGWRPGAGAFLMVLGVGVYGSYWSVSCGNSSGAFDMYFNDSYLVATNGHERFCGFSVRLVRVAE